MARRPLLLSFFALALLASACSSSSELAVDTDDDSGGGGSSEFISGEPTAIPLVDEEMSTTTAPPDEETTTTEAEDEADVDDEDVEVEEDPEDEAGPCDAPELEGYFVDVPVDDPDGGLNMRDGAGPTATVINTFPRGNELITRGECEVVAGRDWWLVATTDGSQDGWVAARFLSDEPLSQLDDFTPGVADPINDTDNVGVSAETLDELVELIAQSYGFDENLSVFEVAEPTAADAVGGEASYQLTGLGDDSVNGYMLDLSFSFDREEDGGEITGYTATRVTASALCTRAVSDDGLCV